MSKFAFTAPVTRQIDTARIESYTIYPQRPAIEVMVSFGVTTDGVYTPTDGSQTVIVIEGADLVAQARTAVAGLTTRLFTALQNKGLLPAGTEQA